MENDDEPESNQVRIIDVSNSRDLPDGHPFKDLTPEQIREEMLRSQNLNMSIQLDVYAEQENVEKIAKFSRRLFDALNDEGFSEEQSLEIVKSIGLPSRR